MFLGHNVSFYKIFIFIYSFKKLKKECKEKFMIWPSSFRSKRQPDPRSLFSAVYGNYK